MQKHKLGADLYIMSFSSQFSSVRLESGEYPLLKGGVYFANKSR